MWQCGLSVIAAAQAASSTLTFGLIGNADPALLPTPSYQISTGLDSNTTYTINRSLRNFCHVMQARRRLTPSPVSLRCPLP